MLQIIIVVFREILEISLILGILTASTKNIQGRGKWIASGLALGLIASTILAFFTDQISKTFDGLGQDIFNGVLLAATAIMISWTIIWMQKHAKSLSGELKQLSKSIVNGKVPLYSLLFVVLFSTLREGAEIVLFSYSSYIYGVAIDKIISGLFIGLALGLALGITLYLGMLKIFGKYFFIVTTWILIFIASGIMAQAFGFWIRAEIMPALGDPIWDSSNILLETSILGKFFHIFLGYIDRPAGLQVIAYFVNLSLITIALRLVKK
ncbi:MAG: iron permease [Rickettsiales bacterium]|nr:iron permease [Rickettsiales bacterium]